MQRLSGALSRRAEVRPHPEPVFELVTRAGCHLCDVMAEQLNPVLAVHGLSLEFRDVDQEAELLARYGDVVPVLLRNGRPVAKVRLQPGQAERLIRRRR